MKHPLTCLLALLLALPTTLHAATKNTGALGDEAPAGKPYK